MKNKKEFIEKNLGSDGITGRQLRLNKVNLKPANGKDYAELICWGDIHLGYPTCNEQKARKMLDWALKNNVYVILMGDLLEAGLKDSIGDSVYRQRLSPQDQMDTMLEWLEPLAKKGLIVGLHQGNHEMRITKATGIDISKIMAKMLNVKYLGYACWNHFFVNNQKYAIYSQHGMGGSRFKHTKLKRVLDMFAWIRADAILCGHHHSLDSSRVTIQEVSTRNKMVYPKKCWAVMTGAYLEYEGSYAQAAEYPPCEIGSPKVKLFSSKRSIHISF